MNFELSPYSLSTSREPWKAPLKSQSQTLLIDSRDRDLTKYPSANNYRVHLPKTIRNISSARLVSAEIPGTFYVFTQARENTTLRVTGNAVTHDVVIPDGNYTPTTIASTLESEINSAFSGDSITFSVAVSDTTNKTTIACTSHPSLPVTVDCSTGTPGVSIRQFNWGLGYHIGFDKKATTGTGTVTSGGVINLKPESYILLKIRDLNSVMECGLEGSGELRSVFAKIPFSVSTSSFGINFFDKLLSDNIINPIQERLQWLDIELVFHDGTPVDFVGSGEHSFTIEVYCAPATV